MDFNKNYYSVLGADKGASQDEIKKIFRKKAIETHPDKHGGDDSEFKIINEAYQIVGDEGKRNQYDVQSPHGQNYNPMGGGFKNIFDAFGGGSPFGAGSPFGGGSPFDAFFTRRSEFTENLDVNLTVDITLEDVYNNIDKKVRYSRNVTCNSCRGTGFDPESESNQCDVCDGSGKEWNPVTGQSNCKYCQGRGRIHTGTCKKCNGEKVILKEEEFALNNIYRINGTDNKYLRGYGNQSKHYLNKRGNLVLTINYVNNDKYLRKSDGLYYKMNLHFQEAIDGKDFEYTHLDSKKYNLKIPPRTKDGDVLRMPNKGLLTDGNSRQNFYLLLNIIIDYDKI